MNQNDNTGPDPLLESLPEVLLTLVEDQLSNNESTSDVELGGYFIDCGQTAKQASRAVQYRSAYANDIYWGSDTPIRSGVAMKFNSNPGWLA